MKKLKIINFYEQLSDKQQKAIGQKKAANIYYNYLDEMEDYELTFEQRGILFSALLFYSRTCGTQPLPPEIEERISSDLILRILFDDYQHKEAKASTNWTSHRGNIDYEKKYTYFEFKDGHKKRLEGNIDNAPRQTDDLCFDEEALVKEFIDYGNKLEWIEHYEELSVKWYQDKITDGDFPF